MPPPKKSFGSQKKDPAPPPAPALSKNSKGKGSGPDPGRSTPQPDGSAGDNQAAEKEAKEAWELNTGMTRVGLRNRPGRKPTWKFTEQNGAFVRDTKGWGIDWYRYLTHIRLPKLLPFATALKYAGLPNLIVMEDKAPAHASGHQHAYFDVADVQRLIWPGNSPDLNMIEICWAYLKRLTTKKGALTSQKAAEEAWTKAWEDLE